MRAPARLDLIPVGVFVSEEEAKVEIETDVLDNDLSGVFVIDVREVVEFETGSVPGAISIPAGEIRQRLYQVPRGATVYLLCANGARSLALVPLLRALGYDAHSVKGGMWEWSAGRPSGIVDSDVSR